MELFKLGVSFPVSDQELEQQMARLWGSGELELLTPAVLALLGQQALRCGHGTAGGSGQWAGVAVGMAWAGGGFLATGLVSVVLAMRKKCCG